MVARATVSDWRLFGAKHVAVTTTSAYAAVSSPATRRVLLALYSADRALWPDSGELDAAPGALVFGSTLWTVCDDGYLRKLNPTTAALLLSVDVRAATTAWLAMNSSGVVIAPGPRGEICTVNTSGVQVDTLRVLSRVDAAVYSAGYLYCFGDGVGAVVSVTSAGVLSKIAEFTATNCRSVTAAKLNGTSIGVAATDRTVIFSIADDAAPAVTSSTPSTVAVVDIGDDSAFTPITADTTLGLTDMLPLSTATYSTYAADWVAVSATGKLSVTRLIAPPAVTWDASNKGAAVVLSNGNLTADITGLQECVRATAGRDPAAGGKYRVDFLTYGSVSPYTSENLAPVFAAVDALFDCVASTTVPGYLDAHAWGFGCGTQFLSSNYLFHNGNLSINWLGSGGNGGTVFIASLLFDFDNGFLRIAVNGTILYSLAVTWVSGRLVYPAFSSGRAGSPGTQHEIATANFGGSAFADAIAGYSPWQDP